MVRISEKKRKNTLLHDQTLHVITRARCCTLPNFPLGVVKSFDQGKNDYHVHENFSELVIVMSGNGIHEINNRKYPIVAGDVFIVQGDLQHGYPESNNLDLLNVIFNWEELQIPQSDIGEIAAFQHLFVIDPVNRDADRFDKRVRMSQTDLNDILHLANELDNLLNKSEPLPGIRFLATGKFMELIICLLHIYDSYTKKSPSDSIPSRLGKLAAMLEQDYAKNITIEKMCKIAGMSHASLFRKFRRYYNDTPVNYLLTQRLRKAGELLELNPQMPVSEAAFSCGFVDSAYFSRQFKKYYRLSPTLYRQKKNQ